MRNRTVESRMSLLGGNVKAAYSDTLKLIEKLLKYFGQQDSVLYSVLFCLKITFIVKKKVKGSPS
jgi:hypothetical protein